MSIIGKNKQMHSPIVCQQRTLILKFFSLTSTLPLRCGNQDYFCTIFVIEKIILLFVMVFHAGIDLFFWPSSFPYLTLYDTDFGSIIEYDLPKDIFDYNNYELLFENVKFKINGDFGCLCIILPVFSMNNNRRNELINNALKIGFKNVKLIEQYTAMYFHAVYHSTYIPENGHTIWIYNGHDHWYIWYKEKNKAKFISYAYEIHISTKMCMERVLSQNNNVPPNVILYPNEYEFDATLAKEMFPECKFFEFFDGFRSSEIKYDDKIYLKYDRCYKGAIIKARIMASDMEMMKYDANSVLSKSIWMMTKKFNDHRLFYLKLSCCRTEEEARKLKGYNRHIGGNLPRSKTSIIKSNDFRNVLSVMSDGIPHLQLTCLPINKKFSCTLSFDDNGVFDLDVKFLGKIKSKVNNVNKKYLIPQKFTFGIDTAYGVGIDLGTTRCCAAVTRRNGTETVALDNTGERLLPSYVGFDEENVKCGQIVLNRLRYHEKSTVFDSKRIIGKKFEDISIDQSWPFQLIQDKNLNVGYLSEEELLQIRLLENNDTFIKVETKQSTEFKYPEEISAALLKHIKQKVEEFEGDNRIRVMITVPSTFTDTQKDSTCAAAVLAGFKIVDFIPEPVAAAFAYLIDQQLKYKSFNFLLFDLGGGTLDICIFKFENSLIEIISQNGDSNLGGRDFDNLLIDYFSQKLFYGFGVNDLGSKKYKLMLECQKIKETLSVNEEAFLEIDELIPSMEAIITITQKEFEELSIKLLQKVETCIINALEDCKFSADEIDKILFVGGGSRMPMIKELLKNIFPNTEHCCASHPDEIVADGAAYYSYYMNSLLKKDSELESLKKYKNRKRKNTEDIFCENSEEKNMFKKFNLLSLNQEHRTIIYPKLANSDDFQLPAKKKNQKNVKAEAIVPSTINFISNIALR